MSRPIRILLTVAILGLACSAGAMLMVLLNRPQTPVADDYQPVPVAEMGLRILPFTLTDQNGETQTEEILLGRWTLTEFIFTNCPGACPIMTSRMANFWILPVTVLAQGSDLGSDRRPAAPVRQLQPRSGTRHARATACVCLQLRHRT